MKYTEGTVVFDSWRIEREIGEGAYGKAFEIRKTEYNITAISALKVITIPKSQTEIKNAYGEGMDEQSVTSYFKGFVDEIVKEISFMTQVKSHPNIVRFEDYKVVQHEDGIGWDVLIRMEYLTPFVDYIYNNKMSEAEVVRLGAEIASALDFCHKKGMIHRDVKPENIFVDENGTFKIGDFGVARTIDKTTGGMSKKGTEVYMAPEVYIGKEYDASVDTYSLGLVLYRVLNGNRLPFLPLAPNPITYEDRENALVKRIKGEPINAPVKASLQVAEIILKACEYTPENRYKSAGELCDALKKTETSLDADVKSQQIDLSSAVSEDNERTVGIWGHAKTNENTDYMPPKGTEAKLDARSEQTPRESVSEGIDEAISAEKEKSSKNKIIVPIVVGGVLLLAGALYAIIGHLIPYLNSDKTADEDISVESVVVPDTEESTDENSEEETRYKTAVELEQQEKYVEAAAVYEMAAGYKDSDERLLYCQNMSEYNEAKTKYEQKEYEEAINLFTKLGDFSDSADWINKSNYMMADEAYVNKDYEKAEVIFNSLGAYEDSDERYNESVYANVKECVKSKNYDQALLEVSKIKGYKDSDRLEKKATYNIGINYIKSKKCKKAIETLETVSDYSDAKSQINKAKLEYVKRHKDLSDKNTVAYLNDLVAYGSSEAKTIYNELYHVDQWKLELAGLHYYYDEDWTIRKSIKWDKEEEFVFRLKVVDGPEDKKLCIYEVDVWPDGSEHGGGDLYTWNNDAARKKGGIFDGHVAEDSYDGTPGTFTMKFYNLETKEFLGQWSVEIK